MNRFVGGWALVFVSALLCGRCLLSESTSAESAATVAVGNEAPPGLIHLDVVVTDSSGKPVTGLGAKDLTLLDNGEPAKILSFRSIDGVGGKSDPPVQVILVIDTFDVPEELARSERVAVESYLEENGGRLTHPTSVMLMTELGFWTVSHPSSDGRVLAAEIKRSELRKVREFKVTGQLAQLMANSLAGEPAPLWALEAIGQIATQERRAPGRKLLLWVGPGWGIGSGNKFVDHENEGSNDLFYTIRWFRELMRESRTVLYSFSVGEKEQSRYLWEKYLRGAESAQDARPAHLGRKILAIDSGGSVLDERFDLVTEIKRCVAEADAYYSIWFDPSRAEHQDAFHSLAVRLDKPGLEARTSTGYYDEPYYSADRYPPAQRVTVAQLGSALVAGQGKSDAEMGRALTEMELTERVSDGKLTEWMARLRGNKERQALAALADASAFLPPPPEEIPTDAPPDAAAQKQIVSLAKVYLANTLPRLPDLLATRTTVRYQEGVRYDDGKKQLEFEPLHAAGNSRTSVRYSHGVEVADGEQRLLHQPEHRSPQLVTYGTFGPMLRGILDAVTRDGELIWSRWEKSGAGHAAVFRFAIPKERSRYSIGVCCLADGDGREAIEQFTGYRGEIAIDPASGAILRLEYEATLPSTTPLAASDVMIEYGPVEIGGRTYICPVHSVSLMRSRSVQELVEWDESFAAYGPYATMLNDMRFTGYRMFRSESRMLPGVIE